MQRECRVNMKTGTAWFPLSLGMSHILFPRGGEVAAGWGTAHLYLISTFWVRKPSLGEFLT